MVLACPVIDACRRALHPEGRLVWVVRDRVVRNEPSGFVHFNARLLQLLGFELLGAYWRPIGKTANYQLRAKKFKKKYGQDPLHIKKEYALVARRKM